MLVVVSQFVVCSAVVCVLVRGVVVRHVVSWTFWEGWADVKEWNGGSLRDATHAVFLCLQRLFGYDDLRNSTDSTVVCTINQVCTSSSTVGVLTVPDYC